MTDNQLMQPCETPHSEPDILRILLEQYRLYEAKHHPPRPPVGGDPRVVVPVAHTVADVYKCLHQGEFGIGHSIDDPVRFGQMLMRELQLAQPNAEEPLLENVSCDGSVFRLNLRPYRGRFPVDESRASALLLDVCLESAMIHRGHEERFVTMLDGFRNLNRSGSLCVHGTVYAFTDALVDHFLREVEDFIARWGHIPVLSHSSVYRRYNAPSYRVVDRAALERSALVSFLGEIT
jgi:hypothetical protein